MNDRPEVPPDYRRRLAALRRAKRRHLKANGDVRMPLARVDEEMRRAGLEQYQEKAR